MPHLYFDTYEDLLAHDVLFELEKVCILISFKSSKFHAV